MDWHGGLIPKKLIHHCTQRSPKRENMHCLKRMTRKRGEEAVSPVVGVMLMLVVTIIIAAVVSGFAGGLMGNTPKPPSLTMDVQVVNTGNPSGSGFYASVLSTSQAIPTSSLKIITSWQTSIKYNNTAPNQIVGQIYAGGNTSTGNVLNLNAYVGMQTSKVVQAVAPFGMGSGIIGAPQNTYGQNPTDPFGGGVGGRNWQWFGNYSLVSGTGLYAVPAPYNSGTALGGVAGSFNTTGLEGGYGVVNAYQYTSTADYVWPGTVDAAQAVPRDGLGEPAPGGYG